MLNWRKMKGERKKLKTPIRMAENEADQETRRKRTLE